ncbi:MAG: NERD domain-containing protein [Phycisphaeraceae bacterium]|nr:NERD domain-containing protein [Phycisphaeraceae bacterium]MCW5762586.1 NERD domain-containing protein [Phycisphaeraceae bacterium]
MAHYLHRAFATEQGVRVIHGLRLVDDTLPEACGKSGVAQMDHLVLHARGAFIVESKSVCDTVSVRGDGSGGDEWTRSFGGRRTGMASPIAQAQRQAEFLRRVLQEHRADLLGQVSLGMRPLSLVVNGTTQRGFTKMPIQIVVAISDEGMIRREKGWKEPTEPFRSFVCKADQVAEKLRAEMRQHRASGGLMSSDEYGVWRMSVNELARVEQFLNSRHQPIEGDGRGPRSTGVAQRCEDDVTPQPATKERFGAPDSVCKGCGGRNLMARWGKYGYYWICRDCHKNTKMPTVCSVCGVVGEKGLPVSIRKEGAKYYRVCAACGIEERIWTEE